MSGKPEKGLLLLAFGGADSLESVEPFVKNVLKGRPVTPELISKTVERYKLIGGKSPLLDLTLAQAKAIQDILNNDKDGIYTYKSYVGMRYWHPFIADTVKQMKSDGIKEAVSIIMAPFTTRVATGGYEADINSAVNELKGPYIEHIAPWHLDRQFIDAIAGNITNELASFQDRKDVLVIFSSHSLPMQTLEGDPYEMIINQSIDAIIRKTGPVDHKAAYQSKGGGPREWLSPQTEEVIQQAGKRGKKAVIIVPLGFVSDHVETLYDIDILFKGIAESSGLVFRRTPSINTDSRIMALLASLVKKQSEKKQ